MAAMLSRRGDFRDHDLVRRNFVALNEQRSLSRFCDVILRVCNTEIFAHANILAAASPYFRSFLGTGTDSPRTFNQKQPQIIEIHIDSVLMNEGDGGYGEAVSKVIDYMYTSQITLTTTLVTQIIEIGKIMLLDKLVEFCHSFQKGIDNNMPKSVFTCTSGLQEVVSLLGMRSKIVKRADVATETDESLFAKLRCFSPLPQTTAEEHDDAAVPAHFMENHGGSSLSKEIDNFENSLNKDVDANKSLASVSDKIVQNQELEPSTQPSLLIHGHEGEQLCVPVPESHDESVIQPYSEASIANPPCFNLGGKEAADTTADSYSGTVDSGGTESSEVMNEPVPMDTSASNVPEVNKTDVEPHKIVDNGSSEGNILPETLPDGENNASSNALMSISFSAPKRQRGRPRRRGRGRGRPPGRPRKVKDPESDPEFDDFMKVLESGDAVNEDKGNAHAQSPVDSQNQPISEKQIIGDHGVSSSDIGGQVKSSKKKDPDYVPVNIKRPPSDELSSSSMWKSTRVRSKPSLLKKDYIFHSLSRKTRKSQVMLINEQRPVQSQVPKRKKSLRFVCQTCDFSTSIFKDYRQHLRSHPETNPRFFVCPKCDFKTKKSRLFTLHKQKHMIQESICTFCDYHALDSIDYHDHLEKHSGESPYFCTQCDSRFKKKNQLMSHNRKHQLEKPFVCAVCDAGFKWKHALKNHMITHSARKDHLCDICGYATAHKSQLKAHKLVHTGQTFKCSFPGCLFAATKRQKLKYHMVTHTHEKPHQCDVCGQRFSLNKNMRRHMLLHSNTRPYACKMCSYSTTRYDKLKEHNYKLHNIGEASVPKKTFIDDNLAPSTTYSVASENVHVDANLVPNVTYDVKINNSLAGVNLPPNGTFNVKAENSSVDANLAHNVTYNVKIENSPVGANVAPNVTYVKSETLTLNPDGTLSQEALQTIAQLATSQQPGDLVENQSGLSIEQASNTTTASGGVEYPIIAQVQYAQVDDKGNLQLITHIAE